MEEPLQTFDLSGNPLGIAPRSQIHRQGLWHRAAVVLVFSPGNRLLVQRRQLTKDICPGLYDVSMAEHLLPGESFEQGAIRGLKEELSIVNATVTPVGKIRKCCTELPELYIRDYEFQQFYTTTICSPVHPDAHEVSEVRFMRLQELEAAFQKEAERYTPWFRRCAEELGLFR